MASNKKKPRDDVHELRLAVKRLRALVRLLAPLGLERAEELNQKLRRVGRKLSPARDSLVRARWLAKHGFEARAASRPLHPDTAAAALRLAALHREILAHLPASSPSAIEKSLELHARKVRKARKRAQREPTNERFHAWRKRAKDLQYQLEWVEGKKSAAKLERLAKLLGRAQDSALIERAHLPAGLRKARKVARKEKKKLWREALRLGDEALPRL